MWTSTRRRLAAVALVLSVPALGACGFNYQTDKVYQPAVGVNNRDSAVDVLGAVVVSGTDGSGTFVASLVNKDADEPATLTSVTAEDGVQAEVTSPVEVAPESLVNLADVGAVRVGGDSVAPGGFVRLTLEFSTGQSTEVNAPVVPRDQEFSGVRPAVPSASPTTAP